MSEHSPHGSDLTPVPGQPRYLPLPKVAEQLGIIVTKVHQLVRDRSLLAVRRDGILVIPGEFVDPENPVGAVKGLPGTITVLTDAGYSDQEIIDWLFEADESLPGTPIQALRENRGREVHRRAQTAGF
ncbi:Rv2175c family DNA-binding protein [Nakamurella flava]|uniref:Rv2175c family DNA-binding protein n=1 Tax=Nakamurella flava TaxID=2576308 RepID=UPI001F0ED722|nr:Rv2175c family DNA-binding protein [Nakamurella flava]